MDVKFSKTGGPFSDDPPIGRAFMVHESDVGNTTYIVTERAFEILKNKGAYVQKDEVAVKNAPYVKDKKKARHK